LMVREQGDPANSYPDRIVDHEVAAAFARSQIYTARAAKSHKPLAASIQNQHGSRKSGIAQVGRTRSAKKSAAPSSQTSFEF
jgi:deoxyribodipyrimidine photo-lyase